MHYRPIIGVAISLLLVAGSSALGGDRQDASTNVLGEATDDGNAAVTFRIPSITAGALDLEKLSPPKRFDPHFFTPPAELLAETDPKKTYPELRRALELLKNNQIDSALRIMHETQLKHPELPSEYVLMYCLLAGNKQLQAARAWLELAVAKTPSDPTPWAFLGVIALQEGRVAEAQLDLNHARHLLANTQHVFHKDVVERSVLNLLAQISEYRENWIEAQTRFEEYLKLAPEDVDSLKRFARTLFWQKKEREAYDALKRAKQFDVANASKSHAAEQLLPAEAIMAEFYDNYERSPKFRVSVNAWKWYGYALKKAPNDLKLHAVVCAWALENGQMAMAEEQAKEAARIDHAASTTSDMLIGAVALWKKRWPVAEERFAKVLDKEPDNFAAKNNLIVALIEQNDPAKKQRALQLAEANASENPGDANALSTLALVLTRRGEVDRAAKVLNRTDIQLTNFDNLDKATYLAHLLYLEGKSWQAKMLLKDALKTGRPFSMKPEALELYEKLKDVAKPNDAVDENKGAAK